MTDVNAGFDAMRAVQRSEVSEQNASAAAWNALTPAQRAEQAAAKDTSAATRFEQRVAGGTMVNLGNGRYKVNEPGSYDNGEVFQVQRSSTDLRTLLVMPEHGLDTSAGKVAFYSRYPEWHDFGTIIPSGLSSIPAVLKAAGIYFDVLQRPAGGWGETAEGMPAFFPEAGKFQNYRSDTLHGLGIVGKVHRSIQPARSMQFLQDMVEDDSVIIESAGAFEGGKRIFITCLLPEHMVIDAGGIGDEVQMHVAVIDRFDGQGEFQAIATPWRIRCGNTERLALANAVTRWGVRHTTHAADRVNEAQRTLGLAHKYQAAFVEEETLLARTPLQAAGFEEVIREVWERDFTTETKKSATMANRREDALQAGFAEYSEELGKTAYAAERAATDYLDHAAPRRVKGDDAGLLKARRVEAAFLGSDDDTKAAVHKKLMLRTR
jgi:phage/plasmid-like protein (TIGR03299 family)